MQINQAAKASLQTAKCNASKLVSS